MSTSNPLYIEYMPVDDLVYRLDSSNPKEHDLGLLDVLFTAYGYTSPVLLNETTGLLLAGHGRVERMYARWSLWKDSNGTAATIPDRVEVKDGQWLIPVIRGLHMESTLAKRYLIADNQATIAGGWNEEQLVRLVLDLPTEQRQETGIDDYDVNRILTDLARPVGQESGATVIIDFLKAKGYLESVLRMLRGALINEDRTLADQVAEICDTIEAEILSLPDSI